MKNSVESACAEAKVVGHVLGLVQGRASGHGDLRFSDIDVQTTTVVYRRNGKTFHLVCFDMTDFKDA